MNIFRSVCTFSQSYFENEKEQFIYFESKFKKKRYYSYSLCKAECTFSFLHLLMLKDKELNCYNTYIPENVEDIFSELKHITKFSSN